MPVLDFKGKSVVEFHHRTVPHHRLEFDPDLSLLGDGQEPSLNGNLIVEGDNLLALKALLPTHRGRVKCVYIDPPYNTGNEGWVYNDNLTQPQFKEWVGREVGKEGEDATRHDKWCCMMYPRLQLLHELLREDGAIFVSIDDNEVHNLRHLLDETFGPENFVATLVWEKVYSPKSSAKYFSENHDFVVCSAKLKEKWNRNLLPRTEAQDARYTNQDDDPRGPWKAENATARNYYSKGTYPITCPSGRIIPAPPEGRYYIYSKDAFEELDDDNRIWWGEDGDNDPALKRFLSDVQDRVPETILPYSDVGHTQDAKKQVLRALGGLDAPVTPKPVGLIERLLTIATDPGDLILDSFAGTGTTGEAVLKMNAEGGEEDEPRRFVLVQQPYDTKTNESHGYNIAEKMTATRVRNAAAGYTYQRRRKGESTDVEVPGLGGTFTYARLGDPLLTDYRTFAGAAPDFDTLAAYVFHTETGRQADPAVFDPETGFVGETDERGGTAYHLLYTPNDRADRELSPKVLARLLAAEAAAGRNCRNWVVYAERMWIRPQQHAAFEEAHGKVVRRMLVPFDLQ